MIHLKRMFAGVFILPLIYSVVPTCWIWGKNSRQFKSLLGKNQILLSFDDGPDIRYTGELLDILAENNIKATFFIVASKVPDNIDIIRRMQTEQHTLALHSLAHNNACMMGYAHTKKDFEQSLEILAHYGIEVNYYRPPFGLMNLFSATLVRKYGLKTVYWHVMAGDWSKHSTGDKIINKLIQKSKGGQVVVCLHDSGEKSGGAPGAPLNTINALKRLLPVWCDEGMEFITLKDLY